MLSNKKRTKQLQNTISWLKKWMITVSWLINCRNCASKHPIRNCPAFGKTCFNCNQKNHFSRCCWKPRRRQGNQGNQGNKIQNMNNYDDRNENTNTEEENQFFINYIDICEENSFDDDVKLEWMVSLKLNNNFVKFKIDSGAKLIAFQKDCIIT